MRREENRSTRKNPRSRDENQQQTQPTYDAETGNRTRATLVGGECSHHCAIPAPRDQDSLRKTQGRTQYPRSYLIQTEKGAMRRNRSALVKAERHSTPVIVNYLTALTSPVSDLTNLLMTPKDNQQMQFSSPVLHRKRPRSSLFAENQHR